MSRDQKTVIEREIRRRRLNLMLKCIICVLIFGSAGLGAWLVYDTNFKDHSNPWTESGKAAGEKAPDQEAAARSLTDL